MKCHQIKRKNNNYHMKEIINDDDINNKLKK